MIDGALWAVIALAVAVVVYVELRIRAVKKATGTAPGFMEEVRDLFEGLRSKLHYVQVTTDATRAAVTAPTVQPAGFVLSEGASTGGVSTKGFVLSEGATLGGSDAAQRAAQTALDRAALNAMREDGVNPKGFVLSEDAPKVPRIEDLEGPKIADWVSVNAPGMMPKIGRIIKWWADHPAADPVPGAGYKNSVDAIQGDQDLKGADFANALAQHGRDTDNQAAGKYFNGPYPIAGVTLNDMFFLMRMGGEYRQATGRDIYKDILYGSVDAVNGWINQAGELHAPEMQAFDVSLYHGPLEAIVRSRMNGL